MTAERRKNAEVVSTSSHTEAEKNIIGQVLQMEVPIRVKDLLDTMPQLRTAIFNTVQSTAHTPSGVTQTEVSVSLSADPMLLALNSGRDLAIVEMGILGAILKDTIVDGGSGVNVLPPDTWKKLVKP